MSNDPTYEEFTYWIQGNGADASPYCAPKQLHGNNGNPHFITEVQFDAFSNSTSIGPGRYNNFSDTSIYGHIDAEPGSNLNGNITVRVDGNNIEANEITVWIDFDQDANNDGLEPFEAFTFTAQDTNVSNDDKDIVVPVSIPIPANAISGETRMRIAFMEASASGDYDGCNFNKNHGEVEDYAVIITGCCKNVWTGAINNDWNDAGNWSCDEVPSNNTNGNVLIPADLDTYPLINTSGTAGYAFNLEIESGANLEVDDNYISIENNLIIDGVLTLTDEGQLLQDTGSTFDDASSGYIECRQQGTSDLYTYNYWSSPVYSNNGLKVGYGIVNNYTLDDVLADVDFIGGYNGNPGPPVQIAEYWVFKFNDKAAGEYSQWVPVGSKGDIIAGEGYTMKGTGAAGDFQEYTFQGKPNNGDITLDLTSGNGYLVGNPYPSALDADQFILDNTSSNPVFDGTIYFWEHWGGGSHNLMDYEGGYATYNLSGGIASGSGNEAPGGTKIPKRYIPVAQGFFITADAGGVIEFNNGQRVFEKEGSNSEFFKVSEQNKRGVSDTRRKIRLGIEMEKGFKKEILLTEDSRATVGFDYGFDGLLMDGYSHDIYWSINEEKYSIQGVPVFNKNSVFELGLLMHHMGEITLRINDFEFNEEFSKVYLLDRDSNTTTEILNNSVSLSLEEGNYLNRFAITFLPVEKQLNNENELDEGVFVYMNNNSQELEITRYVDAEIFEVSIFNILGQEVQSKYENLDQRFLTIPVYQNQGVYVLRIVTDKGVIGQKIIVE